MRADPSKADLPLPIEADPKTEEAPPEGADSKGEADPPAGVDPLDEEVLPDAVGPPDAVGQADGNGATGLIEGAATMKCAADSSSA